MGKHDPHDPRHAPGHHYNGNHSAGGQYLRGGEILMYGRNGEPVVTGGDAISIRGLKDPNPHTNPWAAKDVLMMLIGAIVKRPLRSALVLLVSWFVGHFLLSLAAGTVLVATGKASAVSHKQIDGKNVSQVGFWVGSNLFAPAAQTGGAALVNFAGETAGDYKFTQAKDEKPSEFQQELEGIRQIDNRR